MEPGPEKGNLSSAYSLLPSSCFLRQAGGPAAVVAARWHLSHQARGHLRTLWSAPAGSPSLTLTLWAQGRGLSEGNTCGGKGENVGDSCTLYCSQLFRGHPSLDEAAAIFTLSESCLAQAATMVRAEERGLGYKQVALGRGDSAHHQALENLSSTPSRALALSNGVTLGMMSSEVDEPHLLICSW